MVGGYRIVSFTLRAVLGVMVVSAIQLTVSYTCPVWARHVDMMHSHFKPRRKLKLNRDLYIRKEYDLNSLCHIGYYLLYDWGRSDQILVL